MLPPVRSAYRKYDGKSRSCRGHSLCVPLRWPPVAWRWPRACAVAPGRVWDEALRNHHADLSDSQDGVWDGGRGPDGGSSPGASASHPPLRLQQAYGSATFRLPNFYSTTADIKKAFHGQTGYIFDNDRHGRLIGRLSTLPEGEVLLPPGATYKIVAQYDRPDQQTAWVGPDGQGLSKAAQKFAAEDANRVERRRFPELVES